MIADRKQREAAEEQTRAAIHRYPGYQGMTILRHPEPAPALLRPVNLALAGLLAGLLTTLWLVARPAVGEFWAAVLEAGFRLLSIPAMVSVSETGGLLLNTTMPVIEAASALPGGPLILVTGVVTTLIFFASFRLPESFTPISYLLQTVCVIQAGATLYFSLFPNRFPHSLPSYTSGMLDMSMTFMTFIPVLLGLSYYIFHFSLLRKLLLTAAAMAHLTVLTPLQALAHVTILVKGSLLFMPVLYLFFGILPQIGVFVALYSWGMSWPEEKGSNSY
jgi:hypothetical protein